MECLIQISFMLLIAIDSIQCQNIPPKLILISMDSLKYKFIEEAPIKGTNNFQYMMSNGVLLKQVINVFPSLTYPNHFSLITGLYPESHGIVHNRFYDPTSSGYFLWSSAETNTDSKWFDVGAEPIYVTNTKAGGGRRSGTVLMPTSLTSVKGVAPDLLVKNDGTYGPTHHGQFEYPYVNMSATERVDRIISWFTDANRPINLGLLYFHAPDETAHTYGPDSQQIKDEVAGKLNNALGYLIRRLKENDLLNTTNIILTADHGQTRRRSFIQLDDYIDNRAYFTGGRGDDNVVTGIWPHKGKEDEIVKNLTGVAGVRVYKKDGPELAAMNYTKSDRIPPIVVIPDIGVVVVKDQDQQNAYTIIGEHGYDPVRYPELRPVFIAMGPDFKTNYESTKTFGILDIYPLMCHLLNLNPAPNNGSLDNVRHLLFENANGHKNTTGHENATGHENTTGHEYGGGQERRVFSITLVIAGLLTFLMSTINNTTA